NDFDRRLRRANSRKNDGAGALEKLIPENRRRRIILIMNSNQNIENMEDFPDETGLGDATSVDDFIKQLEAREKDLQISSDLVIEVGESEFDDKNVPEFFAAEPVLAKEAPRAKNFAVASAL